MLTLFFGLAGVFSAQFLKNAFDMRKEKNWREMVGSLVWPSLFFAAATLASAVEGSMPIRVQNTLLALFGAVLGASILVWAGYLFRDTARAQTTTVEQNVPNSDKSVTGLKIEGNNQGGAAAEIVNSGGGTGADINVVGSPGQSLTGLHVTQSGPGTGLRIIQNGPGVGLRVGVTVGKPKD